MTLEYSIVLIVFLFLIFTFMGFSFRLYNYVITEMAKEELIESKAVKIVRIVDVLEEAIGLIYES